MVVFMNRLEVIDRIREAKQAHTQWVGRAMGIISAPVVDKDEMPILHTDCDFGHWYYGDGQMLSFSQPFQQIEMPHTELHSIHMEIFDKLFKEAKHSVFLKYFGRSRVQTVSEKTEEAKQLLGRLEQTSNEIIDQIHSLENEIIELGDEDFARRIVSGNRPE